MVTILLFLERLQQRDLLGVRDAVELGRLGDVDQLRDAELAPGIVDVGLPAEVGADVLHLHADLPHLAPQLVVDELLRRVGQHVLACSTMSVVSVTVLNVDLKFLRISDESFSVCWRIRLCVVSRAVFCELA